ncbi:MAG: RsmE family RNA methyltransferase [Candidatus Kryptonium sp.]
MESFYIDPRNVKNNIAKVEGEEFHHLARVSRKKKGELIYLFDGSGKIYTAKIINITHDEAECEIIAEEFMKGELETDISIAQAFLKSPERFEFAIEKLTELGVKRIIPIVTERVVSVKDPKYISPNKIDRWKRIILSACKQSNRALLPELCEPIYFKKFIQGFKEYERKIIFHESDVYGRVLLWNYLADLKNAKSILVAIGPEGGFTDEEIKIAVEFGFDVVSLGERRLRSETASIIGVGVIVQFFLSLKTNNHKASAFEK